MSEANRLAVVVDNSVVLFDINGSLVNHIQLEGKGHLKFSGGKWNPHQNGEQVTKKMIMSILIINESLLIYFYSL